MNNKIYNVVILDKSGSMNSMRSQAVGAVNETFGCIRSLRKKNAQQEQLVTLVAFCGCEQNVIYENAPIEQVADITEADYQPCCATPLYDTIGSVCTRLHTVVKDDPTASVAVTVITDGYENASREFSGKAVKALIEAYKSEGWMFAYIGADHDVESVAFNLSIDNHMAFEKSARGFKSMTRRLNDSRICYAKRMQDVMDFCVASPESSPEELKKKKKDASAHFFDR